jgi:hypothetical protein
MPDVDPNGNGQPGSAPINRAHNDGRQWAEDLVLEEIGLNNNDRGGMTRKWVLVLAVIAGGVVAGVVLSQGGDNRNETAAPSTSSIELSSPNPPPTRRPSRSSLPPTTPPPPPTSTPTAPVPAVTTTTTPSATPTTPRPTGPHEAQRPALVAQRAELEQGMVVTPTQTAARDRALDWMLQQDGLLFDNNAALRQRYCVVALAFGLQQQQAGRRLANDTDGTCCSITINCTAPFLPKLVPRNLPPAWCGPCVSTRWPCSSLEKFPVVTHIPFHNPSAASRQVKSR